MNINGTPYRTIWLGADGWTIEIIDQTRLPHEFVIVELKTVDDAARAIKTMQVRGAPLIGATAAFGLALALRADASDASMKAAIEYLNSQRPTAVNLRWALEEVRARVAALPVDQRAAAAYVRTAEIIEEDVKTCQQIGVHGYELITQIAARKKEILEQECYGLIEVIEPDHGFTDVGGMQPIKNVLTRVASHVREGRRT